MAIQCKVKRGIMACPYCGHHGKAPTAGNNFKCGACKAEASVWLIKGDIPPPPEPEPAAETEEAEA